MSWSGVWKRCPLDLRAEIGEAMFEQFEEVGELDAIEMVHEAISRGCRTPVKRFRNQSRNKRAKLLARASGLGPDIIESALRLFHLRRRAGLLSAFLDNLGLAHTDGGIDTDPPEPLTVDQLGPAMRKLLRVNPAAHCSLYWDVLTEAGRGIWQNLAAARENLVAVEAEMVAPNPKAATDVPREPECIDFTHLDAMVIDAVVASVAGTEGALSREQARALVEELAALNGKRFISYHHLGFMDGMEDRVDARFPEANEGRRGWYLTGAVAAFARRAEHGRILELLDAHRHDFDRFLRITPWHLLLPLFEALRAEGRVTEAVGIFRPQAVADAGLALREPLLSEIVGFLRYQKVDEAEPLLDLLTQAMALAREPIDPEFDAAVQRRRAHCLRLRRKWSEADALLATIADENDGSLLADRGLVACRIRGLVDVLLPSDPAQRSAYAAELEAGREWFGKATRAKTRRGHGDYCLGVLHLAREEVEQARPHLRRAVAEMQRSSPIYRELGILGRAELYSAFVESTAMESSRVPVSLSALASGLEDRPKEVPDLVRRTLENLALVAPSRTRDFLSDWQSVLGDDFLDIACQGQFLREDEGLRDLVRRRAERTTRSAEQRFFDHEALLAAAIATGEEDAAADELDALEALADEVPERFLKLVDSPERCGTLWDVDDVAQSKARVLRGQGKLGAAASCLRDVAFRLLRDDDRDGVRQAAELAELIESFGVEPEEQLKAAIRQEAPDPVPRVSEKPRETGKILFVGGHETQARYDDALREYFAERYPGIELVLKHPGWESTWARQLKRMESDLQTCDAMVIMRFVRTQLGRALRKHCGKRGIRWYACTGHGLASIRRAIEIAAAHPS